jgi:hypothetical protein
MVHGRKHELVFETIPTGNQMLGAVELVLGRKNCWRCLSISPDKLTYVIEEIDIQQTLSDTTYTPSPDTISVKAYLKCHNCGAGYETYRLIHRLHDSVKQVYNYYTLHCPACPPISTDIWLATQGFWPTPPPSVVGEMPAARRRVDKTTLAISDDELAEFL